MLAAVSCARVEAQAPAIEITYVPAYGSTENLRGRVLNADPATHKVAAYLFVEGVGWFVKPTAAEPCTLIQPDGTFEVDVTTGGQDIYAHRYAVFLLPVGESCVPACNLPDVCGIGQCLPVFLPEPLPTRPSDYAARNPYTLQFSGYTWIQRHSPYAGGPEGNCFLPSNAVVDGDGHLRISLDTCGGEVWLGRGLGYGEYRIHTSGRVDDLDPQAVFGMFTWDPDARAVHREMDIELSRWGVSSDPNAQFVVQPWCDHRDRFQLPDATELTFIINWAPGVATFSAHRGHHFGIPPPADLIHQAVVTSGVPTPGKERFRFNLWRYCRVGSCSTPQPEEVVVTYFRHTPPPLAFHTLAPCRIADTRNPDGPRGGPALTCRTERRFTLAGQCDIPTTARALSVNLAVTGPSDAGNLRLYPGGTTTPTVSAINYSAGQTRANNAIIGLGADGTIGALCSSGTTHLVLDVNGYFD